MEGKLSFDISLDDEIVSWPFRKMLLQPFVENSIIHGIKPRGGRGFILVSASKLKEGWIVITISDNGQGMTEEEKKKSRRNWIIRKEKRRRDRPQQCCKQDLSLFRQGSTDTGRVRTGSGNEIYIDTTIPEKSRDNVKRGE